MRRAWSSSPDLRINSRTRRPVTHLRPAITQRIHAAGPRTGQSGAAFLRPDRAQIEALQRVGPCGAVQRRRRVCGDCRAAVAGMHGDGDGERGISPRAAAAFARSPSSPAVFLDGAVFMHRLSSARAPTGVGSGRFRIRANSCVLMRDGAI